MAHCIEQVIAIECLIQPKLLPNRLIIGCESRFGVGMYPENRALVIVALPIGEIQRKLRFATSLSALLQPYLSAIRTYPEPPRPQSAVLQELAT